MFNVGDYVIGTPGTHYGITNDKSLCVVTKIEGSESMRVLVKGSVFQSNLSECDEDRIYGYLVRSCYFVAITPEEYSAKFPNAYYAEGFDISSINTNNNKEGKTMTMLETVMNKVVATTLTAEETKALRAEIIELLNEYDYNPTERAVNKIIDEWIKNKGWMVEIFKKHPNYNGKFQIVFDADYNRTCDKRVINDFRRYFLNVVYNLYKKEARIGCFTYAELENICYKLSSIKGYFENLRYVGANFVLVDGKTEAEIKAEYDYFYKKRMTFRDNPNVMISGGVAYDKEAYETYRKTCAVYELLYNNTNHIATEDFVKVINDNFPEVKAVVGQKVSRIVNKLATQLGVTKDANWNREFAKYSDAINPLTIKRHTILSCHPVDYLTMSFGNSWASCHTIDKHNRRGMPDDYNGCYSSGTLSYMLDNSSFVFYTVDKDYTGEAYELQSKINRNMFHVGEDKLIQARVYPQANDGESGLYKQIREIAQRVVADCYGLSNMWKNVKGTEECCRMITSRGTHYTDYASFSSCNVSYLKRDEDADIFNNVKIVVGHSPICPSCGDTHDWEECIECEDCYDDDRHSCANCGDTYDEDDMYYIDGEYYCEDCCFYCDYHEEYEVGESDYYVDGYGHICEDAFDNGDFAFCEQCDDAFWTGGSSCIETEDGTLFCCEDCARRGGYVEIDGKWYDEDETVTCEHCGELILEDDALETADGTYFCGTECASNEDYVEVDGEWYPNDEVHNCERCGSLVHDDDWDEDHNCCIECAEELEEELEDEE